MNVPSLRPAAAESIEVAQRAPPPAGSWITSVGPERRPVSSNAVLGGALRKRRVGDAGVVVGGTRLAIRG
jgi:hypothetical protein